MKQLAFLFLACPWIIQCGDSAPTEDAGLDTATDAPERCARERERFRECDVCIEPHATLIGGGDGRLYPVEGGVLYSNQTRLVMFYVSDAGEVVDVFDEVPEDLGANWSWLEPIPNSRRVWGIANLFGAGLNRDEDEAQLVLLEVSDTALTRLASIRFPARVGTTTALDTGELLLSAHGTLIDEGTLTVCAFEAASGVTCRELGGTEDVLTRMWSLDGGNAAIVTSERGPLAGRSATWLYVGDRDGVLSGPAPIHSISSVEYEEDEEPQASNDFVVHDNGTAAVLLSGTFAGMDATPFSHHFLRRIDADGGIIDPAPGIWVNPDQFPMIWSEPDPLPGRVRRGASNQVYVSWDSFDVESSNRVGYFQLVEQSGSLRLPESRRTDGPGAKATGILDRANRLFGHFSDLTEANPERPFEARFGVNLASNDDLEYLWEQPLYYQDCERVDEQSKAVTGAYDDGVWVVWEDVVVGGVDGLPYTQLKIARIMPDGDYGWRFDE